MFERTYPVAGIITPKSLPATALAFFHIPERLVVAVIPDDYRTFLEEMACSPEPMPIMAARLKRPSGKQEGKDFDWPARLLLPLPLIHGDVLVMTRVIGTDLRGHISCRSNASQVL